MTAYEVRFHADAIMDLNAIEQSAPTSYARLLIFFEEFLGDPDWVYNLALDSYEDQDADIVSVVKLSAWRASGYELRRVKLMGLDTRFDKPPHYLNHRIIYAFDDKNRRIWLLGVFHRGEFDYNLDEPNGQRIIEAYNELKLPRIRIS